jgi:hypothetical protein
MWMRICETGEHDKHRVTVGEIKFIRRTEKYIWLDYKTNEGISSRLKIN